MLGHAAASAFWPPTVPEVAGRAHCGNGDVLPPQRCSAQGTSGGMAHPRALSGIKGSRVREGTWASQRAGRARTKEAETA